VIHSVDDGAASGPKPPAPWAVGDDAAAAGPRSPPARAGSWWRTRGISIVPLVGDLIAMLRLLSDPKASIWAKLLVVAAIGYVVCPIDLIPDAIPFFGWLDDAGIVIAMRLVLHRQLERYRYPLFGEGSFKRWGTRDPPRSARVHG
jgi:uncharacterized membrane protein YkvA (DUF1232 family)